MIDFTLAHFDSLSLKREIEKILDNSGTEFQFLEGALVCVRKRPDSEMFDSPKYVFVRTEHWVLDVEGNQTILKCNWSQIGSSYSDSKICGEGNVIGYSASCYCLSSFDYKYARVYR